MNLFLSNTDVHLWRVDTEKSAQPWLLDSLSADERHRAASYRAAQQRSSYVLTRFALRDLLTCYVETVPGSMRFQYGSHGKPALVDGPQFSISRSSGIALICFARVPCGIDVERVDQDFQWQGIARHFLSSVEQRHILESSPESQAEAFLRCWTRREAYCKAHGTGLASLERDCFPADQVKDEKGGIWSLLSITRYSGYAAALCVNTDRFNLAYFDWNDTRSAGTTEILQSINCE